MHPHFFFLPHVNSRVCSRENPEGVIIRRHCDSLPNLAVETRKAHSPTRLQSTSHHLLLARGKERARERENTSEGVEVTLRTRGAERELFQDSLEGKDSNT